MVTKSNKKQQISNSPKGCMQSSITKFVTSPQPAKTKRKLNVDTEESHDNTVDTVEPLEEDKQYSSNTNWNKIDPITVDINAIPDPQDWYTPSTSTHTSAVWRYVYKSASISYLVQCKCGRRIKCINSNTTNISNHLRSHHRFDCCKLILPFNVFEFIHSCAKL